MSLRLTDRDVANCSYRSSTGIHYWWLMTKSLSLELGLPTSNISNGFFQCFWLDCLCVCVNRCVLLRLKKKNLCSTGKWESTWNKIWSHDTHEAQDANTRSVFVWWKSHRVSNGSLQVNSGLLLHLKQFKYVRHSLHSNNEWQVERSDRDEPSFVRHLFITHWHWLQVQCCAIFPWYHTVLVRFWSNLLIASSSGVDHQRPWLEVHGLWWKPVITPCGRWRMTASAYVAGRLLLLLIIIIIIINNTQPLPITRVIPSHVLLCRHAHAIISYGS